MTSLDLPQNLYLCSNCGAEDGDAVMCGCPADALECVSTLTYRDFEAHYAQQSRLSLLPDPFDVFDRLERVTDSADSNRQAIDNAIRACGR